MNLLKLFPFVTLNLSSLSSNLAFLLSSPGCLPSESTQIRRRAMPIDSEMIDGLLEGDNDDDEEAHDKRLKDKPYYQQRQVTGDRAVCLLESS